MLIAGGAVTSTAMLTPTEAEQHRDELAKSAEVRRVYMAPIGAVL